MKTTMKILVIVSLVIIILGVGVLVKNSFETKNEDNKMDNNEERLYQGPVPEGYDEEHFRKTGETKLLEE